VKRIAILGSTGSIGRSALAVVDAHPTRLQVAALAAGDNASLLAEQIETYRPRVAAIATAGGMDRLRSSLSSTAPAQVLAGAEGLLAVATHPDVDIVICASAGTAGLEAVLAAIEAGKTIALANKEVLVMAGALVTEAAHRRGEQEGEQDRERQRNQHVAREVQDRGDDDEREERRGLNGRARERAASAP